VSVSAALTSRGMLAASQLGIMACIAVLLAPEEQGYLATARNLLGLQVVLELGFSAVLVQVFAHERGRHERNPSRPLRRGHVLRLSLWWFLGVAVVMILGISAVGYFVMIAHDYANSSIRLAPWLLSVAAASVGVMLLPLQSLIEGSGHVVSIALMRGVQALAGLLAFAILAALGKGLWALPALIASPVIAGIIWLWLGHRHDLWTAWRECPVEGISWHGEIFPFQWRIALSWACGWAIFQLNVPVLFSSHGPIVAGQMGLTLDACTGITSIGMAWIGIKTPGWGRLIALGYHSRVDVEYARASRQALLAVFVVAVIFVGMIILFRFLSHPLAERFLPPLPLVLLVGAALLNQSVFAMASYLRAHKQEPFLVTSAAGAVVLVGWALWGGARFGALGMAIAYLATTAVIGFFWGGAIFRRCRRTWHTESAAP
jgi:O-antigen/teichoic acid export membrane protein